MVSGLIPQEFLQQADQGWICPGEIGRMQGRSPGQEDVLPAQPPSTLHWEPQGPYYTHTDATIHTRSHLL